MPRWAPASASRRHAVTRDGRAQVRDGVRVVAQQPQLRRRARAVRGRRLPAPGRHSTSGRSSRRPRGPGRAWHEHGRRWLIVHGVFTGRFQLQHRLARAPLAAAPLATSGTGSTGTTWPMRAISSLPRRATGDGASSSRRRSTALAPRTQPRTTKAGRNRHNQPELRLRHAAARLAADVAGGGAAYSLPAPRRGRVTFAQQRTVLDHAVVVDADRDEDEVAPGGRARSLAHVVRAGPSLSGSDPSMLRRPPGTSPAARRPRWPSARNAAAPCGRAGRPSWRTKYAPMARISPCSGQ